MEKRALVLSGGGSKGAKVWGKLSFLTKEMLHELYWNQKKSFAQIAKELGGTQVAIIYQAKKLGVPSRNVKEASKLANSGDKNPAKRPEVRAKLSGENNHFYGKVHSDTTKKKMSVAQKKWNRKHWTEIRWNDDRKVEFSENNPMKNELIRQKHTDSLRKNRHKFSGSNSPRWKGGITQLHQKIRQLAEYKEWRRKVYEKHGCLCATCNNTIGPFNVDHIVPFSTILQENKIKSIKQAIDCKALWNTNNGRILCVECHKKTDTYGGNL